MQVIEVLSWEMHWPSYLSHLRHEYYSARPFKISWGSAFLTDAMTCFICSTPSHFTAPATPVIIVCLMASQPPGPSNRWRTSDQLVHVKYSKSYLSFSGRLWNWDHFIDHLFLFLGYSSWQLCFLPVSIAIYSVPNCMPLRQAYLDNRKTKRCLWELHGVIQAI